MEGKNNKRRMDTKMYYDTRVYNAIKVCVKTIWRDKVCEW